MPEGTGVHVVEDIPSFHAPVERHLQMKMASSPLVGEDVKGQPLLDTHARSRPFTSHSIACTSYRCRKDKYRCPILLTRIGSARGN